MFHFLIKRKEIHGMGVLIDTALFVLGAWFALNGAPVFGVILMLFVSILYLFY